MKLRPKIAIIILFALACLGATGFVIKIFHDYPNQPNPLGTDILLFEKGNSGQYFNIQFTQLRNWMAFGTPPTITSFNNSHPSVEIGATVNTTTLTWTLGGSTPTTQSVNQGIGSVPIGTLTATDGTSYTVNRTYTLTVANTSGTTTANTTVSFLNKRYWGPQALTSLTDLQIRALSSEFASTFVGFSKPVVCNSQYIYFAFPSSFGTPIIYMPVGLQNTAWTLVTRNFQNASGFTTSYDIYRSNNLLTGTFVFLLQ